MQVFKRMAATLWKMYFFLILVISLLILYPWYYVFLQKEKYFGKGLQLTRRHARFLLTMAGVRYHITGREHFSTSQAFIVTPNHTSYLDILLLYVLIPGKFVFVGKSELLSYPLFNIFFKEFNIAVDRERIKSGHDAMNRSKQALADGYSVVIFPEGTIPAEAPKVSRFKNGAFKLAMETHTPIVPVIFHDNYHLMEDAGLWKGSARPGKSRIVVKPPVSPTKFEDLVALRSNVHKTISKEMGHE